MNFNQPDHFLITCRNLSGLVLQYGAILVSKFNLPLWYSFWGTGGVHIFGVLISCKGTQISWKATHLGSFISSRRTYFEGAKSLKG